MEMRTLSKEIDKAVRHAAEFIVRERDAFDRSSVSDKGLNQLVSYVDIQAEKILIEQLSRLEPEAGFITEENTVAESGKNLNWIIDPLDGTTNFIHGLPVFSVSVALAEKNDVLAGTVFEMGRNEQFSAWKGGGSWLNGQQIKVSETADLKNSLLATGFPYYEFEHMDAYIKTLQALMKRTHGLRRLGSAAVDLAYVACGRFEGFFEYGLHAWDVAAGCLLVKEAGGRLSDFRNGDEYIYGNSITASNGSTHDELLSVIQKYFS